MPANLSESRPAVLDARRRRRRLFAHLLVLGVAALLTSAVGAGTASARNVAAAEGMILPSGTATATYTCTGADPTTQGILDSLGISTFQVDTTVTSGSIASPEQGASFDIPFTWTFTLSEALVSTAASAGVTEFDFGPATLPIHAVDGASGEDQVGNDPGTVIPIVDPTQSLTYSLGPFTGTFTRTSAVGEPITLEPGQVHNGLTAPIPLNFVCDPGAISPMVLVDEVGDTTTTASTTTTLATTTSSVLATTTTQGGVLPVTGGGGDLRLVVLALALIDIGYLAWSAGQPRRRRVRPTT